MEVNPSMAEETNSERLRADYRGAFKDWALQVNRLQGLALAAGAGSDITEAERQVEVAEAVYRDSRNRLTDDMNQSS